MKAAIVEITPELLEDMLHFTPEALRITGASWRAWPNTGVLLRIEGDCLPDRCVMQEGQTPDRVEVMYRRLSLGREQIGSDGSPCGGCSPAPIVIESIT